MDAKYINLLYNIIEYIYDKKKFYSYILRFYDGKPVIKGTND